MSVLSSDPDRRQSPDAALALICGGVALLGYLLTLAPTVETNDAGRFQTAAPLLGTGHPTGYPTFILLGKLFTLLPLGDVAYRVNLMSAVFGAVAVGLAYLVMRNIGANPVAATGCSLLFAFMATLWSQATVAEVYTMHAAFVLAVFLLLLRWRETGRPGYLVSAAVIFGAGLGNNAGLVLFGPAYLLCAFAGRMRFVTRRSIVAGAVALLVGISVYAYIPVRGFAGAWSNYGDEISTWSDVWNLVSGARFRGLMDPSLGQLLSGGADFAASLASQVPQPFGTLLAALLALGAVVGAVRIFADDAVAGASLVLGGGAALLYAMSYRIDDIAVYFIPVFLVMVLLLSVGVTGVSGSRSFPAAAAPLFVAALVFGLNFEVSDRSDDYVQRERSEATLAELPPDAILYGKLPIVPITYLSEVEGQRPDVSLRWLDGGTLRDSFPQDLASGRPLYFVSDPEYDDEYLSAVEDSATSEREGDLILITPK